MNISELLEQYEVETSMFNMMKQKDPDSLAIGLVNFLTGTPTTENIVNREKCALLLSKLLTEDDDDGDTWRNLSKSTQSTVKFVLLDRLSDVEESFSIVDALRVTVSKVAALLLPGDDWPEFLPFLYQCVTASTSNDYVALIAFILIMEIAEIIAKISAPCVVKDFYKLFLNTVNDEARSFLVRRAAMSATLAFIPCMPSSNEKEQFQYLLALMITKVIDAAWDNSDQEESAQILLNCLIQLAKDDPMFLRMQLVNVVGSVLEIAGAEESALKEWTRHLAVEFLITLVEAKEKAPGMMRRLPSFMDRCFAMLLKLLVDIKDDPAWHISEVNHDDSGTTQNFARGADTLQRFSLALGGKSIAHIAKEQLSYYLASPEWEKRHAALIALAYIAEGCSKVMIKDLEQVVNMVLNGFQDPHPRVRWAACCAISQFLLVFSPHLQQQYHDQVLPTLAAAMDDFHPRVQARATSAFCNFGVPDKPETLIPHLDGIVNKLLVLLQNDKLLVQQQALDALASVTRTVEDKFRTYYDTVMLHLKTVVRNADLKSNLILRAKAIQCISFVGLAVGKEKFRDDEKQVMEMLMSLQVQVKVDDPTTSYTLKACGNICMCLGQDFLPYMSAIMPFFALCAQLEPAMTISAELDHGNCELDDNMKRDVILFEDTCIMLLRFVETLKEDFYPWISQAVSIFVPLLKFYAHNIIRKCSAFAMCPLLSSAKVAVEKGIVQGESESCFTKLSDYLIRALLEALHKEHVTEICGIMLFELNKCLQICQPLLNEGQLRCIVDEIMHVITERSNRKKKLAERAKGKDFDAEEEELLRGEKEQEDHVIRFVGMILITLTKVFKAAFLSFFDELSSYVIPMWGEDKTASERSLPIEIFICLVTECPEAALKYCDVFLHLLLEASNDEHPAVRQNALYGLRLSAEYCCPAFKPFVREALSRINVVIMHFHAREPENERAFDNAVSALGNICQLHRESIDSTKIIPIWLNCLPLKGDLDEAKNVHDQLCSMVERSDGELLGPDYHYLPKIISVFVEVLYSENDLATVETAHRIVITLRHLQQTLPPSIWESAWSYVLPQQEMELKSNISPEDEAYL